MKKILGIVAVSVLALAGLAYAQAIQQVDLNVSPRAAMFTGGLLLAPRSLVNANADVLAHRITKSLVKTATIDFASQTITCVDSAVTLTGAAVGDLCITTGSLAPGNANFTCYVSAANTVQVHFCPAGTATDPASQTFTVRIFSNL